MQEEEKQMAIPKALTGVATAVLVEHQRRDIEGCLCGWAELGKSFAEHQAKLVLSAVFAELPHFEDRINVELPPGSWVYPATLEALAMLVDG